MRFVNGIRMTDTVSAPISIIPIPSLSNLLPSIQEYIDNLVDLPELRPALCDSISLLARTTKFGSERDIGILSEMTPSLAVISRDIRTERGRELLYDYLGDELAKDIIRYWEEDEPCV